MGGNSCCVVNCKNNGSNSNCKFYKFPIAQYKLEQRRKWIAAVRKINPDGSSWSPRPHDVICSDHFIGNRKAEEQLSPSYVPTIFTSVQKAQVVNKTAAINRHNRFMKRRNVKQNVLGEKQIIKKDIQLNIVDGDVVNSDVQRNQKSDMECETDFNDLRNSYIEIDHKNNDKECQVDFLVDCIEREKTFICNRYIDSLSFHNDVEIQTNIIENSNIVIVPSPKNCKDEQCDTQEKSFVDKLVGPDNNSNEFDTKRNFCGITSVKNEQLSDQEDLLV